MANTGANVQLTYAKQADMTTRAATGFKALPVLQESITATIGRLQPQGAVNGQRTMRPHRAGNKTVGGSMSNELVTEGILGLLEACLGGLTTTGVAAPYTHELTPDTLAWYTLQFADLGHPGTHKDAIGAMVNSWSISWDASGDGNLVAFQQEWFCHNLVTNQTKVVAAYPVFTNISSLDVQITLGGVDYCVDSGTISGANALRQRHAACADHPGLAEISEMGRRDYTGTIVGDAESGWTRHDEYLSQAVVPLVFNAAQGAVGLKIESGIQWTGETKTMQSVDDVIKESLPFQCVGLTDADVMTMTLTSTDATV